MKEFTVISLMFTAIGGWLGWFVGGCDKLMYVLIIFTVIDYITGLMCAISDRKLSSTVGFKGICRKVLIFMLVGMSHMLDINVIGTGSAVRSAVIFFYLSNEGISFLENTSRLGLPVPRKLRDILQQFQEEDKDEK